MTFKSAPAGVIAKPLKSRSQTRRHMTRQKRLKRIKELDWHVEHCMRLAKKRKELAVHFERQARVYYDAAREHEYKL
jgi:hypothetical protein